MIDPNKLISWLQKNGFERDLLRDRYTIQLDYFHPISFKDIYENPEKVVRMVDAWFRSANMFYQPWDGDDDDDTDDKTKAKHNAHHSVMNDPYGKWYNTYKPEISKECMHEWKDYIGLNERFKFCTKCDKKDNQ